MNSRAPISGFDSPSQASRATCASWQQGSSPVSVVRLRACSPVVSNSRAARRANASPPMLANMSYRVRSCSCPSNAGARAAATRRAAGARVRSRRARVRPLDRLPVQPVGRLTCAQERPRVRSTPVPSRCHSGVWCRRDAGVHQQRGRARCCGRRHDRLQPAPGGEPELPRVALPSSAAPAPPGSSRAIVEECPRVLNKVESHSLGRRHDLVADGLDQAGRFRVAALPASHRQGGVRRRSLPVASPTVSVSSTREAAPANSPACRQEKPDALIEGDLQGGEGPASRASCAGTH
jgi:hypothetical protein